MNALKHGERSAEALATRREITELLKAIGSSRIL
jgi:hypothetical protein